MSFDALTLTHVVISLIGIASGILVVFWLFRAQSPDLMTAIFLATTLVTSLTGFLFPFHQFLPSHAFGILSVIALGIAIAARYHFHFTGPWRSAYAITTVIALYFNVFVLIAQLFLKVPALKALAPTQTDPPFLVSQLANLVLFVAIGVLATKRFVAQAPVPPLAMGRGAGS
jgi:hypothetical protein